MKTTFLENIPIQYSLPWVWLFSMFRHLYFYQKIMLNVSNVGIRESRTATAVKRTHPMSCWRKSQVMQKNLKPTLLSITSNMVSLTEVKMQFYQISDKNTASPDLRESPAAADNTLFTHILSFGYITHTVWMSASVLLFVSFIGLLNTWLTNLATEPTTGKIKERLLKNFKL